MLAAALLAAGCAAPDGERAGNQSSASMNSGGTAGAPAPAGPIPAAALVGRWRSDAPAVFAGEGYRTETSGGETEYRADGTLSYRARLAISGDRLPAGGLPFLLSATGEWRLAEGILTERLRRIDIAPAAPNPTLARLAADLARDLAARPASSADLVTLAGGRMTLRDRATGRVAAYVRADAAMNGQAMSGQGTTGSAGGG